jgi:flavin reductase (DIM6/NTAB) family NADH-FMN oxidoreductase RutF
VIDAHLVAFGCETYARYDGGDHVLLLGKVLEINHDPSLPPKPLLYYRGQYRELSDLRTEAAIRLEGW